MDRTINVTVTGEFVRKDSKNAGVQGEANVTGLHIVMTLEAAKETAPAAPKPNDLVPIRLFKDNDKYKDDVFVAVNGRSFQIKRGETVQVPAYVAEVLEQSMAQDNATANLIERESSAYAAEAKARNI